jgi:hypothetical protein
MTTHERAMTDHPAGQIRALQHRVEATGRPGVIRGLTGACIDCGADAEIVLLPGKAIVPRIRHDDGCPAAAGITEWQPDPID